ncbi:hypothetical protein ACFVXC_17590 [Streptomyces sp. NPDC058257]|uniref:hypothetical protein n=1 Tax=Streptomyces sp. NPDC058257 TaxID=3346409 RepID=UPI0036E3608E
MPAFPRTVALALAIPAAAALSAAATMLVSPAAHASLAPQAATAALKIVKSPAWSDQGKWADATCPAGTGLVGGGYKSHNSRNGVKHNVDAVDASAPSAPKPNTWAVKLHHGTAESYAMCAPGAPVPKVVVGKPGLDGHESVASCPKGMVSIGGGYNSDPVVTGAGAVVDFVQTSAPVEAADANGWKVEMMHKHGTAYVMCVK